MFLKGEVKFLGKETRQSKKGNSYLVVLLQQGVQTLNCISDIDVDASFGEDFIAELDYNPNYRNIKLIGAYPCNN